MNVTYGDKGGAKSTASRDYLSTKKAFSDVLSLLELALERPKRIDRLWSELYDMNKDAPKPTLPVSIQISSSGMQ
jgi:hypothetical protein